METKFEQLAKIFPEVITEKNIDGEIKKAVDFDKLKDILSDNISDSHESYDFTWVGKNFARAEAYRKIDKTLRPCVEESKNFDATENLYIEGDNLEVLKLLQQSYLHKVKMIYIDPPYNTGNDFIYRDNFKMDEENATNQIELLNDEDKINFNQNSVSNPRFHSDWCSMIYSRLLLARNLLTDDGVIFISIDDNEQANLKKICDEVFGESNFVASLIWKSKSGGANDSRYFAVDHEYLIVYAKSADKLFFNLDIEAETSTSYNRKDERGEYSLERLDKQSLGYLESLDFPIKGTDGKIYTVEHKNPNAKIARWRWSKETVAERYNELVFENGNVYTKNYKKAGAIPRSLLIDERFGRTRTGKTDFAALFCQEYFSNPKPFKLIKFLTQISTDKESIILDFFSGSATTAHAVMQLNAEDGGRRKFILVQLPEKCAEKSEAFKAGYKNICEIGKERIRRAGEKIKSESPLTTENLDTGFRVFKVDSTNFKNFKIKPSELTQEMLKDMEENIKPDRNALDLLFGSLISWGVVLDRKIAEEKFEGATIYTYDEGSLIACFDKNISLEVVKFMAQKNPLRAVFRDACFSRDDQKINAEEIFKHYSPNTKFKVI